MANWENSGGIATAVQMGTPTPHLITAQFRIFQVVYTPHTGDPTLDIETLPLFRGGLLTPLQSVFLLRFGHY